jgi:hypothetical protein
MSHLLRDIHNTSCGTCKIIHLKSKCVKYSSVLCRVAAIISAKSISQPSTNNVFLVPDITSTGSLSRSSGVTLANILSGHLFKFRLFSVGKLKIPWRILRLLSRCICLRAKHLVLCCRILDSVMEVKCRVPELLIVRSILLGKFCFRVSLCSSNQIQLKTETETPHLELSSSGIFEEYF